MFEYIIVSLLLIGLVVFIIASISTRKKKEIDWTPDFIIQNDNIKVKLSKKTQYINADEIRLVVNELIDFWQCKFIKEEIEKSLFNLKIEFTDVKYIQTFDCKANAFYNPHTHLICIATIPSLYFFTDKDLKARIRSLLKHEISHTVLCKLAKLSTDEQHELFANLKLGA